jgi:hypothetical protein
VTRSGAWASISDLAPAARHFGLGRAGAAVRVPGGLSNELWRVGDFAIKRMVVNADNPDFADNVERANAIERRAWLAGPGGRPVGGVLTWSSRPRGSVPYPAGYRSCTVTATSIPRTRSAAPTASWSPSTGMRPARSALDWTGGDPSAFADAVRAYARRSGTTVPDRPWVFAGGVAAQGGWLDHNTAHGGPDAAILDGLRRLAGRLDVLPATLGSAACR